MIRGPDPAIPLTFNLTIAPASAPDNIVRYGFHLILFLTFFFFRDCNLILIYQVAGRRRQQREFSVFIHTASCPPLTVEATYCCFFLLNINRETNLGLYNP